MQFHVALPATTVTAARLPALPGLMPYSLEDPWAYHLAQLGSLQDALPASHASGCRIRAACASCF